MPIEMQSIPQKKSILLYSAAVFLFWMSLYLYVPTLPIYALTRTKDLSQVGLMLSMYGLWQAIVRLPLGIATDKRRWHRPFILAGLVLAAVSAWLMAASKGIFALAVGRAISGLAAATWVPQVAVFSALFPPQEAMQASAMLTLVSTLGRITATTLSGPLTDMGGYPLPFYAAVGVAILAIMVLIPFKDRELTRDQSQPEKVGPLIFRRDVLLPGLLNALAQYVNYATTFGFVPTLAKALGAGNIFLGMLATLNLGIYALGNLLATILVQRLGAIRLLVFTFSLLSLGIWSSALAPNLGVLLSAQVALGLAQGIGYPVLLGLSIQNVNQGERATAMGMHQAVYAIGMFAGPWLSGILAAEMGIRQMFSITAIACLILGLLGIWKLRTIAG